MCANVITQLRSQARSCCAMILNRCCCTAAQATGRSHTHTTRKRDRGTLYVHWPFCLQLCSYCNFNKYVRDNVPINAMVQCLTLELRAMLQMSGVKEITSVYFGGGTPSLAQASMVEAVINEIQTSACLLSDAEVTLEANPTSTETQRLTDFKYAGVNRLSLGIQCLNDRDLQVLNRDHTTADAIRALQEASVLFPRRTNVDLIFGRSEQTLELWDIELRKMLTLADGHVSVYQLTLERGTALWKSVQRGEVTIPDPDYVASMYEQAVEVLEAAGLKRYEVSNFAWPACQSSHNIAYWVGSNYIGIGPGAHSRFELSGDKKQFAASINTLEPNAWMKRVKVRGCGIQKITTVSRFQRLEEVVASTMRTSHGLTRDIWESFQPIKSLYDVFGPGDNHWLDQFYTNNKLICDNKGIRATKDGLVMLDSILPYLLSVLDSEIIVCSH